MKKLTAFQKHQITQMVSIDRETLDDVLEAIEYVKAKTPAFTGPPGGPHSVTQWTETSRKGDRQRTVKMSGTTRRGGGVTQLKPSTPQPY